MRRKVVRDVMTKDVVSVRESAHFKDIVALMQTHGVTAVPVVDEANVVTGVVSEADLMLKEELVSLPAPPRFESRRHRTEREKAESFLARDLMTSPAVCITEDVTPGEAARIMHAHGVKRLPVVDEFGRLGGIVSRGDILSVFLRSDDEIREEITHDVILKMLWIDPSTLRVDVKDGVVAIIGTVETYSLGRMLAEFAAAVEGVVGVDARLRWELDDRHIKPPAEAPWGVLPPSLRRP